jgi:hypothetical protein
MGRFSACIFASWFLYAAPHNTFSEFTASSSSSRKDKRRRRRACVWIKVYLVIGRARGVAWDILGAGLTFIRRQRIKYKAARRKCFWEFSCGLSIYDVATQLFFL